MKRIALFAWGMSAFLWACKTDNATSDSAKSAVSTEKMAQESAKANAFFDRVFQADLDRDPVRQTYLGVKKDYDKWTDLSDAFATKELEMAKLNLDSLHSLVNFDLLDEQTKISYKLFELEKQKTIDNFPFRFHNYPINQMDGAHSDLPSFLINIHTVNSKSDAEAYIKRLEGFDKLFAQLIEGLKTRQAKGIIPPKFVFPMVQQDCKNILSGKPFTNDAKPSSLLEDITQKVNALDSVSVEEKQELIARANKALLTSVKPAYDNLTAYLLTLERLATNDDGAWKFPQGQAFYNQALKNTTTTHYTADEIHAIGLKEVARIHDEMRKIMKQVNFKSDNLQAFFEFMRTDKRFYYTNDSTGKKRYMKEAIAIIDNMRTELDKLFITKPKAQMIIKAVEPFREKSAGGAFYNEPALDGSRPGIYYINLYNMADQATYQMEALAYHEGIPGHHMQISIAQELKGLPKFRTLGGNTAYVEGWALYSELIPKELGYYKDPYNDFGRLAMELFRAARLVVDTGIHSKKWTRAQALAYFNENTPNPEGDNKKEIDRYIVWPSQATGYKIGMLKIVELRELAKKELGEKFDIREFHDVVLTNGPVPMNILEDLVKSYIQSKKA